MEKAPGFDRQKFTRDKRRLQIGKRGVEYVVMNPPEVLEQRHTVLLIPGFLCRLSNMALLGHELTRYGYQAIPIAHELPDESASEDIRMMIEEYYAGRFGDPSGPLTLVEHSLAAINGVECLVDHPALIPMVHGVVQIAPAGYGGVSPFSAPCSVATELAHRPSSHDVRDAVVDALTYTYNCGRNMLQLANRASKTDISSWAQELASEGLMTTALIAEHDRLIAYKSLLKGLNRAGVPSTLLSVPHAGHNAHLLFPAKTAGDVVLQIRSSHEYPDAA